MPTTAKMKPDQALRPVLPAELDRLLAAYAAGDMSRQALQEATGLPFEDVLAELGRRQLRLSRVDCTARLNEAQLALYHRIFG